jgi:hypothetical protein
MTLVRDNAQQFWEEDLGVIEKRLLGARSVTDLPTTKEDWRVPNQGSVLAFSTVNINELIGKPSLRVWLKALKQTLLPS